MGVKWALEVASQTGLELAPRQRPPSPPGSALRKILEWELNFLSGFAAQVGDNVEQASLPSLC